MSTLNFYSLRNLHDSANDLLGSPNLKRPISNYQQDQTAILKVSESSLKMLDSCERTKDVLFLVKTHIQELQSTFHRITLGDQTSSSEKKLSAYHLHRKDLRKQMLKRLKSLKMTKRNTTANNDNDDDNLMVVANVLGEVRKTITLLVESLMLLMYMPSPNPKDRRLTSFNGIVAAKTKFMRVNSLSRWDKCDVHAVRQAIERLEAVESDVEDLEVELECIFKRLIRTRVLLLNKLSN